jgi:outer membrane protein assembly factor BamB
MEPIRSSPSPQVMNTSTPQPPGGGPSKADESSAGTAAPDDGFSRGTVKPVTTRRFAELLLGENLKDQLGSHLWEFSTGKGDGFNSAPLVTDSKKILIRDSNNLYALDMNGALKWEFRTNNWDSSPPLQGPDGTIYTCASKDNAPMVIAALDPETGKARWESPVDDVTSIQVGHDGTLYMGSNRKNLVALDGRTGEIRWKAKNADYVHVSGAASDSTIIYNDYDKKTFALNARSGAKLWEHTADSQYKVTQHIGPRGEVLLTTSKGIVSLDPKTGEEKWKKEFRGSMGEPLFGPEGIICLPVNDERKGTLHALSLDTGDELWNHGQKEEIRKPPTCSPTGIIYCVDESGTVTALHGKTGAVAWEKQVDRFMPYAATSPLSDGSGMVTCGFTHDQNSSFAHSFAILDERSGEILRHCKCPTTKYLEQPHVSFRKDAYDFIGVVTLASSPETPGLLLVGTGDGKVVALGDADIVKANALAEADATPPTVDVDEEMVNIDGIRLSIGDRLLF